MMGWQIGKDSISDNVSNAIRAYIKKHGNPPTIIVEHNPKLQVQDVQLPVGLNIVLRAERIVLPSMLLIGESHETSQMGMVVEEENEVDLERVEHEKQEKVQEAKEV